MVKNKGNPDQAGVTVKICSLSLGTHLIPHNGFSQFIIFFHKIHKVNLVKDASK
jgi:hypothetical protein